MNKVMIVTLGIVLSSISLAGAQQAPTTVSASTQTVEVGNKICPVSGEKVGEMGPPIKYTYNGKVYNLCCPMCNKSFKNNPEKYSKIAEDQAKTVKK